MENYISDELNDSSTEKKVYAKLFNVSDYKGKTKNDITYYECEYILRCIDGDFTGKQCELRKIGRNIIIGNDKETSNFFIEDENLSKNHCKLEFLDQTYYYKLTDLNSKNGTWLRISNLEEGYEIKSNTYFKLINNLFLINFTENNKIYLEVLEGEKKGKKLMLKNDDSILIGKKNTNIDLELPESCENLLFNFIRTKGKIFVTCQSPEMIDYGMYFKINKPVFVRAGDYIMIGNSTFRILSHNWGVFTDIGDRLTQEDRYCIIDDLRIFDDVIVPFYAVYDGHGGNSCSEYLSKNFHKHLHDYLKCKDLNNSKNFLEDLCCAIQDVIIYSDFDYYESENLSIHQGSTSVFLLFIGNLILCCNLGDSLSILNKFNNHLLYLSRDLKPNRELEKKRIEYRKGYVSNDGRLLGIINVSRAFGDWKFKDKNKQYLLGKENIFDEYLITNKAEFRLYEYKPKEDFYVILCSDGIFQNNSTQQVFGLINDYLSRDKNDNNNNNLYLKNIPNIVDNVRLEIINNNIIDNSDNITMIMLQLNNK